MFLLRWHAKDKDAIRVIQSMEGEETSEHRNTAAGVDSIPNPARREAKRCQNFARP